MSSGYEWAKGMLAEFPDMTGSRLGELAVKAKVKVYPSLVAKVKQELGIKTTRGRPCKSQLGMTTAAKAVEAKMAKTIPARTNASFDDAIAVMRMAKALGGYGVLYDIVDKLKKAGFE